MTNVIRPTFGAKPRAQPTAPEPNAHRPLRIYGDAAGHLVALIEDPDAAEGPVFKVVVGPVSGAAVEPVAILPATREGGIDADVVGLAVLRALLVTEAADDAPAIP